MEGKEARKREKAVILRVPDYYKDFSCIADKCKDSCCIGWEIDIDEDSQAYYESIEGEFGDRLRRDMYTTEDGDCRFRLKEHGRCPFLNSGNLCDIYIELGEEALGDVCTEYPRFAVEFGNVRQKVLSLSCEVVGKMLFNRAEPDQYVDYEQPGELEMIEGDDPEVINFVRAVMDQSLDILKDRSLSIRQRMKKYLLFVNECQEKMNSESFGLENLGGFDFTGLIEDDKLSDYSFEDFNARFYAYDEMDPVSEEWINTKNELLSVLKEDTYNDMLTAYIKSEGCRDLDYEHIMYYFTFRYMMNAVYDFNLISYAKLAVVFTLVIRDMDAVRFASNGGKYTIEDRIDVARIFSKEVEHSEENFELAKEELLFGEVYSLDELIKQI